MTDEAVARSPALPWAAAEAPQQAPASASEGRAATQQQRQQDAEPLTPLTLDEVNLQPDDRIEVKWEIGGDEGMAFTRWWGATVVGPSADHSADNKTYDLLYDEFENFPPETKPVLFLGDHVLADPSQEEELAWRLEGEEWEVEEEDDEEEAAGTGSAAAAGTDSFAYTRDSAGNVVDRVVTLRQYADRLDDGDSSADTAMNALMQGMDPYKQRVVAERFAALKEMMGSFMAQQAAAKGPNGVVEERDVHEFIAKLKGEGKL